MIVLHQSGYTQPVQAGKSIVIADGMILDETESLPVFRQIDNTVPDFINIKIKFMFC